MLVDSLPLMIGGAAILHCFFLIAVLHRLSSRLSNKLLALLLLFLAIRMSGCIAGLMYADFELAGIYLGAFSFAMAGPLFFFYLRSLWTPTFHLKHIHSWHMGLPGGTLLLLPFSTVYFAFGLYLFSLLSMTVYVVLSFAKFKKTSISGRMDNARWKWTNSFSIGIGILLALFLSQSFFFDAVIYQGIIVGSAFVLYFLTLAAVKQVKLFMYEPSKRANEQQIIELGKRIEQLLNKEEIYTDSLMSINLLAKNLKVQPYLVSLAVNMYFEKSFPEVINALRIQMAERLLTDPRKSHFTIESIAYESGFSTLSAFYTAFKKANHKTPLKFRNHSLQTETHPVAPEDN